MKTIKSVQESVAHSTRFQTNSIRHDFKEKMKEKHGEDVYIRFTYNGDDIFGHAFDLSFGDNGVKYISLDCDYLYTITKMEVEQTRITTTDKLILEGSEIKTLEIILEQVINRKTICDRDERNFLIRLYDAIQDDITPPTNITGTEYAKIHGYILETKMDNSTGVQYKNNRVI